MWRPPRRPRGHGRPGAGQLVHQRRGRRGVPRPTWRALGADRVRAGARRRAARRGRPDGGRPARSRRDARGPHGLVAGSPGRADVHRPGARRGPGARRSGGGDRGGVARDHRHGRARRGRRPRHLVDRLVARRHDRPGHDPPVCPDGGQGAHGMAPLADRAPWRGDPRGCPRRAHSRGLGGAVRRGAGAPRCVPFPVGAAGHVDIPPLRPPEDRGHHVPDLDRGVPDVRPADPGHRPPRPDQRAGDARRHRPHQPGRRADAGAAPARHRGGPALSRGVAPQRAVVHDALRAQPVDPAARRDRHAGDPRRERGGGRVLRRLAGAAAHDAGAGPHRG
jgi:hypothetical protein